MGKFNLIDEAWIPVIYEGGGRNELVSLRTVFEEAHLIQRLAGDTKTQDFAVFRVLLAIMQTVFSRLDEQGRPYEYLELDDNLGQISDVDEDDKYDYLESLNETWDNLWKQGRFRTVVSGYLEKWHDRFFLFDDRYPFFQVLAEDVARDKINKNSPSTISGKFMNRTISESNNKTALFSPKYDADSNKEILSADEVARWLITYQSYTGLADKTAFNTKEKYKNSKGWLYDLGAIYIEGKNLFETLLINCILIHPRDSYRLKSQKPCWENTSEEMLNWYLRMKNPDNLAQLYTIWSRAIYIDPETDLTKPFSFQIVKLPDLNHQNQFLEPMTLWRFNEQGDNKDKFTPRKHVAYQSLWRSFGLIAMPSADDRQQYRPGIISWLEQKIEVVGDTMIKVCGVSMQDDGNATSWVPTDEITDSLSINDYVLTDIREDHWVPRIESVVEKTGNIVNKTYWHFLSNIAEIRNIKEKSKQGFIDRERGYLYFEIDIPFRNWLAGITPNENKDEKVQEWLKTLEDIVKRQAKKLLDNASNRDITGIVKDDRTLNIATAYNDFIFHLNRAIKN